MAREKEFMSCGTIFVGCLVVMFLGGIVSLFTGKDAQGKLLTNDNPLAMIVVLALIGLVIYQVTIGWPAAEARDRATIQVFATNSAGERLVYQGYLGRWAIEHPDGRTMHTGSKAYIERTWNRHYAG